MEPECLQDFHMEKSTRDQNGHHLSLWGEVGVELKILGGQAEYGEDSSELREGPKAATEGWLRCGQRDGILQPRSRHQFADSEA